MGNHPFGIWTIFFLCLIVILPWYDKDEVNAKSLDNIDTDYEHGMEAKFDEQNNVETTEKNRVMKQINKNKKTSQKGKKNGKTTKNGKTKKKGEGSKGKNNGKQENNDEVKNPETSSINSAGDLEEVLVEGDMILDRFQFEQLKKGLINEELDGVKAKQNNTNIEDNHRNALINKNYHWDNRIVYYSFDFWVPSRNKEFVRKTLTSLQEKISGCLKFKEDNRRVDRIQVFSTKSKKCADIGCCRSAVGYQHKNKIQVLELSRSSCWKRGTIEHEFLHAIGIRHEQSRSDRNKYVRIKTDNIKTDKLSNFDKYDTSVVNHYSLPYDYYSVMHYSGKAWSKNGRRTIVTMDPSKQNAIGQKDEGVTIGDIQLIQHMYGCSIEVTYGRCYEIKNGDDQTLPYKINAGNKNSAKNCKFHCYKYGFDYAGVSTTWCYCGNYIPSNSLKKPSRDCSTSCPYDRTQRCGANWRYNVFRTNTAFVDGTCYLQHPSSPIYTPAFKSNTMTPNKCKERCLNAGYAFAGVQKYDLCFCGRDQPHYNRIKDSLECNINCKGDSSKKCGGSYSMSVYRSGRLTSGLASRGHQETPYFNLNGGYKGNWGYYQKCRYPHFVTKMELKIEDYQGRGDDTALNAIRLTCSNGLTITSAQGGRGRWRGVQSCPSKFFMYGAQIRRESEQGKGDDTAANGVRFNCIDTSGSSSRPVRYPGDGYWGSWSSVSSCGRGNAVIGLVTQVQQDQGRGDDTGLNNVGFYCAKLPHIQIIYPGSKSVRSQTRINLEETKEKKIPDMNTTQTTMDDTKIGRIANQTTLDNTKTGTEYVGDDQ